MRQITLIWALSLLCTIPLFSAEIGGGSLDENLVMEEPIPEVSLEPLSTAPLSALTLSFPSYTGHGADTTDTPPAEGGEAAGSRDRADSGNVLAYAMTRHILTMDANAGDKDDALGAIYVPGEETPDGAVFTIAALEYEAAELPALLQKSSGFSADSDALGPSAKAAGLLILFVGLALTAAVYRRRTRKQRRERLRHLKRTRGYEAT